MRDTKARIPASGQVGNRGVARPLLGSLLLAAVVVGLPACEKKDDGLSEAVEEFQDEVKDTKDEIKDEIDDNT